MIHLFIPLFIILYIPSLLFPPGARHPVLSAAAGGALPGGGDGSHLGHHAAPLLPLPQGLRLLPSRGIAMVSQQGHEFTSWIFNIAMVSQQGHEFTSWIFNIAMVSQQGHEFTSWLFNIAMVSQQGIEFTTWIFNIAMVS